MGIGDTLVLQPNKEVQLTVTARCASWIDVDTLRIYVNGELIKEVGIEPNKEVALPLSFQKDAFITAEVQGEEGGIFSELMGGMPPFAFYQSNLC